MFRKQLEDNVVDGKKASFDAKILFHKTRE